MLGISILSLPKANCQDRCGIKEEKLGLDCPDLVSPSRVDVGISGNLQHITWGGTFLGTLIVYIATAGCMGNVYDCGGVEGV